MIEWWSGLTGELQVFYGIGILTSIIMVGQLILNLFGIGDDGDLDLGDDVGDLEHSSGLGLISTRTIIAFLVGFGWTGAILRSRGSGMPLSILAALIIGFLLMVMIYWLMRGLYALRGSGSLDYRNAIGQVGTVYVSIPAGGQDTGQIHVMVQGRLATVTAETADSETIKSGSKVRVTAVSAGNTLQVERVEAGRSAEPQTEGV